MPPLSKQTDALITDDYKKNLKSKATLGRLAMGAADNAAARLIKSSEWFGAITVNDISDDIGQWLLNNSIGRDKILEPFVKECKITAATEVRPLFSKLGERIARQHPLNGVGDWIASKEFATKLADQLHTTAIMNNPSLVSDAMKGDGKTPLKAVVKKAVIYAIKTATIKSDFQGVILEDVEESGDFRKAVIAACDAAVKAGKIKPVDDKDKQAALETKADTQKHLAEIQRQLLNHVRDLRAMATSAQNGQQWACRDFNDHWMPEELLPKPPNASLAVAALTAIKKLEDAIKRQDYSQLLALGQDVYDALKKAGEANMKFRDELEGRNQAVITGLEVLRDVSFESLKVMGMIATLGAGRPLIYASVELLKSTATETGKVFAHTSPGLKKAGIAVAIDTGSGLVEGCIPGGSKMLAGQFTKSLERVAGHVVANRLKQIGEKKIGAFLLTWAGNVGKDVFKDALAQLARRGKGVNKGNFENNLWQIIGTDLPVSLFGGWLDDKMTGFLHNQYKDTLLAGVPFEKFKEEMSEGSPGGAIVGKIAEKMMAQFSASDKTGDAMINAFSTNLVKDPEFQKLVEELKKTKAK